MAERIPLTELMGILDLLPDHDFHSIFPSRKSEEAFLAVYGWTMIEFETELIKLFSSDNMA